MARNDSNEGFNGAAPVKVRKPRTDAIEPWGSQVLQWGRTREGAETLFKPADVRHVATGFNGAAPVKVRKHYASAAFGGAVGWLQWGRTREGAETPHPSQSPAHARRRLQWGRTREGAETSTASTVRRTTFGFNGAAPVKVRKLGLARTRRAPGAWLQWGRTREGAETRIVDGEGEKQSELQWGRTREGAETPSATPGWSRSPSFNGAAPVKVRKQRVRRRQRWQPAASMGPHP